VATRTSASINAKKTHTILQLKALLLDIKLGWYIAGGKLVRFYL